ncbi:MAG: hypothetical protein FWF46_03545 [Oscillospiraceae bacterium]|nr:hypothetical protein [Oscillospiraceae bacterium]
MYRIFCESYINFINSFDESNYRLEMAKPLELIVDIEKYAEEEKKKSEIYKRLCDLIAFMKNNITKFPKLKAFLWTLSSRNINGKEYNVSNIEDLEEQTKLVNSFLKLAYWY